MNGVCELKVANYLKLSIIVNEVVYKESHEHANVFIFYQNFLSFFLGFF
jgi:hypothetical protein